MRSPWCISRNPPIQDKQSHHPQKSPCPLFPSLSRIPQPFYEDMPSLLSSRVSWYQSLALFMSETQGNRHSDQTRWGHLLTCSHKPHCPSGLRSAQLGQNQLTQITSHSLGDTVASWKNFQMNKMTFKSSCVFSVHHLYPCFSIVSTLFHKKKVLFSFPSVATV